MGLRHLKEAMQADSRILAVNLTSQEEVYVLRRSVGTNPWAAAKMAGFSNPKEAVDRLKKRPEIEDAILYMREQQRQSAIAQGSIRFTKDDATSMYLAAHAKAENATEEIRATDSLVKLHGLAAPEQREITVTSAEQLKTLSDEQLMDLAGKDILLSPDQYSDVTEDDPYE